ncbi:MAG: Gfo/Idh/MocA family oxidoreductase [Armatimonadota bacterium]|nr:Gfo/Idh/MocA family oxidoreductase [Armatimonadota bacterium]
MKAKIGIIGCGIGNKHAGNFPQIENGVLVGMCDLDEKRVAESAARWGCPAFTHYEAMLDEAKPDGVMVCTPPYVRMPLIEDVAARGLAVFCEKPPAADMAAARAARRSLQRHNTLNSVGFMYRWMQAADRVKSLIAGRPVVVCQITGIWEVLYWAQAGAVSTDYFYRDRAGGPMVEQGVHLIDVARFVLDDEVDHVHGRGANVIHPLTETFTTEETIGASLAWRKGTVGSHIHCWTHHGHIFQILFVGVDFALTLDLARNRVTGTEGGQSVEEAFDDDYYVTELKGFCDAILQQNQTLIRGSYADACHTLAVATTVMESIDRGIALPVPHW